MRILFWNIRGLNSGGRKKRLGELMIKHQVDVIYLQETIKQHFTPKELANLARGQDTVMPCIFNTKVKIPA